MAPEVFQQKAYTLSADVYAIGRCSPTRSACVPVRACSKLTVTRLQLQHILRASFPAETGGREPAHNVRLGARARRVRPLHRTGAPARHAAPKAFSLQPPIFASNSRRWSRSTLLHGPLLQLWLRRCGRRPPAHPTILANSLRCFPCSRRQGRPPPCSRLPVSLPPPLKPQLHSTEVLPPARCRSRQAWGWNCSRIAKVGWWLLASCTAPPARQHLPPSLPVICWLPSMAK